MKAELDTAEALRRAQQGLSVANYAAIYGGFMAKGIPEEEILPRENVFTFQAWRALGRVVKKGEHGVKITTYIEAKSKGEGKAEVLGEEAESYKFPRTTTVFHISQTVEAEAVP